MLSHIISLDGYAQTVGPHRETEIIHITDREMWKYKELNYCPGSIIKKVADLLVPQYTLDEGCDDFFA